MASRGVAVRYCRGDGRFVDAGLDRVPVEEVLAGLPVREFRSWRGRKHYSDWYWSATTGGHVVYESRLELVRILLADQDPDVVAIAAQPFLMEGFDGTRTRRHVPDLLLGLAGGAVTVVDVKPAHRLGDAAVVEQMSWTARICADVGWGFELWSGTDAVLVERSVSGRLPPTEPHRSGHGPAGLTGRVPECVRDPAVDAVLTFESFADFAHGALKSVDRAPVPGALDAAEVQETAGLGVVFAAQHWRGLTGLP